jgi:hypothetical protein
MRYVFLIYEAPKDIATRGEPSHEPYLAAWRAYHKALAATGAYVAGEPLKDPGTATTVRIRDARRQVQDGPYAEAKQELGGFMIVDFPSLDVALEWAARCPAAERGGVEVRPADVDLHDAVIRP